MAEDLPVLVVGATGFLGGQVVDELLKRGKKVRALVRPKSNAAKLEAKGVEIARGDMLDAASLVTAMTGVSAAISTAAGYTRNDKNAKAIDTFGNSNLAVAAKHARVPRFVLISIVTSDQTPQIPHFWNKKLAEDKFEELGVPFVALRPGAFFDQAVGMGGDPFEKGRFVWLGSKDARLTFVLASDVAAYLAEAVDADIVEGERIDIGWSRPLSIHEAAELAGRRAGKQVKVVSIPSGAIAALGKVTSKVLPLVADMASMVAWFETGKYVADTTRQEQVFGPPPTPEDAIARVAERYGH
ncbi:SDR family oxidoreductase [Paenarthrobacter aurescens]|uniref:NAD dependent epimerase/dehydratase family protein n=1 Tax=Paenarthrobacter aurescens (strain TC1) TaxID=290340 RepID=A1RBM4_PAEAT|nr:SDR family oxidoreductase [Paenarthrobacter aurescens]ABM08525.1 putative NAD dependent epimerase/dehydratase family protein [Paenarthrobacter aurescens TC1]